MLGAGVTGLSVLYACYSLYAKFFLKHSPQGFTALIVAVTFLSGVLLFFLGVIGEYVGRIYEETKARPIYMISQVAGRTRTAVEEVPAETRVVRLLEREVFR